MEDEIEQSCAVAELCIEAAKDHLESGMPATADLLSMAAERLVALINALQSTASVKG